MKPSKKAIRAVAVMLAKEDASNQCYQAHSDGYDWNYPDDIDHFYDEDLVNSHMEMAKNLLKMAYRIDEESV